MPLQYSANLSKFFTNSKTVVIFLLGVELVCFGHIITAYFVGDDFVNLDISSFDHGWRRFLLPQFTFLNERFTAMNMHGRPFLLFTFGLEQWLWKLNPVPFHLTNLIIHFFSTWLLYLLCRDAWNIGKGASFASALLFMVHPEHLDAVTWISGRGASLASMLVLLSLWLWHKKRYWVSIVPFLFGVMIYEVVIALPLILACLYGKKIIQNTAWIALVILDGIYIVVHILFIDTGSFACEASRLINTLRYIAQWIVPFFDSPRFDFYNIHLKNAVKQNMLLFATLGFGLITLLSILFLRNKNTIRYENCKLFAAAGSALLPSLSNGLFAPRIGYLASAFFCAAIVKIVWEKKGGRWTLILFIIACAISLWDENAYWKKGGDTVIATLQAAANGESYEVISMYNKLVPVFYSQFETAFKLYQKYHKPE